MYHKLRRVSSRMIGLNEEGLVLQEYLPPLLQ
nr:MAG TPA: hypothetical protein [Caudoviricetes sp.]